MPFLLPCACGTQIPVESKDAGLMVTCSCGAQVKVPTTRGLNALPRIGGSDAARGSESARSWGLRNQLLTAGLVCLLFGGLAISGLVWLRPMEPSKMMAAREINSMPPEALVDLWVRYQEGFEPLDTNKVAEYQKQAEENSRLIWIAGIIAAGGAAMVVGAFLVPKAAQ